MYHHISEDGAGGSAIAKAEFEDHLQMLTQNGYTAVLPADLLDFANKGRPLPDKPILLTFDDGYASVFTEALPLLKEYGLRAASFVIGVSVGKSTYKDTGMTMTPHFSFDQARQMEASGIFDVQSHTHDLHQVPAYDGENCRVGMVRLPSDTEDSFAKHVLEDLKLSREALEANLPSPVFALAYPYGRYDEVTESLCRQSGFCMTLTTEPGLNCLTAGDPNCLYGLRRFPADDLTAAELLALLENSAS